MQVELLMQIEDTFMIVPGEILAQSSTVYTVTVNPVKISNENKEKVASKLSEIFELDYNETLEKVNQNVAIVNIVRKIDKEKTDILREWMNETGIIDGININNSQAYVCTDPTKYNFEKYSGDYVQVGYANNSSSGYISKLGYDENYPLLLLPIECSGVDKSTGFTDYYYQSTSRKAYRFRRS